jgi:hypothetical protein
MTTSRLYIDPDYVARAAEDDKFALAFARIECHYFVNGGFFKVPSIPPLPPPQPSSRSTAGPHANAVARRRMARSSRRPPSWPTSL